MSIMGKRAGRTKATKFPPLAVKRKEIATDEGVDLEIRFAYDGIINLADSNQSSDMGTMTFLYPLCRCRKRPDDGWGDWEPQPPPAEDAPEEEKCWDRLCRSLSYQTARFSWSVEQRTDNWWACIVEVTMIMPDAYGTTGEWRRQSFTNTMTLYDPLNKPTDEILDGLRKWLQNIARHEVDELFLVNGERRYDPHAIVGANVLAEYDEQGELIA
jgi:hypothetical protein